LDFPRRQARAGQSDESIEIRPRDRLDRETDRRRALSRQNAFQTCSSASSSRLAASALNSITWPSSLIGVNPLVRATMLSTFSARSCSRLSSSSFHFRPLICAWRRAAALFQRCICHAVCDRDRGRMTWTVERPDPAGRLKRFRMPDDKLALVPRIRLR
jgi:hypothetical protein